MVPDSSGSDYFRLRTERQSSLFMLVCFEAIVLRGNTFTGKLDNATKTFKQVKVT